MTETAPIPASPIRPSGRRGPLILVAVAILTAALVVVVLLATGILGGSTVNRMSLPQKVTVGTSAYCQTMAEAPGSTPGADYDEWYILQPPGLPISGTRLEADIQSAQAAYRDGQVRFFTAVKNVLADCQYILAHTP